MERKDSRKKDLGPAVASFANTLGGWLLLGVSDDGRPLGLTVPGRDDLQRWLTHKLRGRIDPMPHFVSRLAPIDGQEVGVVRVYEGALKPYVTGGTVYVREPGGGRPARDRAEVMALARESVVAESAADARLNDRGALPMMSTELDLPPVPPLRPTGDLVVVVRATPIQLPSHFAEGVLTEVAAQRAVSIAANLANSVLAPRSRHRPFSRSSGEGYVATCDTQGHGGGTPVVTTMGADAGGLVALSPSTPQAEPPHSPGRQGGVVQADGQ